MKTIPVKIIAFFAMALLLNSNPNFIHFDMKMPYLISSSYLNGETAVLGFTEDIPGEYLLGQVILSTDFETVQLPNKIETEFGTSQMLITTQSRTLFDSNNNIWVSGLSLYKYSQDKLEEFFINDKFRAYRKFTQFCVDKFNNIWSATAVFKQDSFNFSELYKFDGKNFTFIQKSESPWGFSGIKSNIGTLIALPNGNILTQRVFVYTEKEVIDSTTKDLYIYNQQGTVESSIKLINSFKLPFDSFNRRINFIYPENSAKFWLGFGDYVYFIDDNDKIPYSVNPPLTLIDGDEILMYDTLKGLPLIEPKNYEEQYAMCKFGSNKYFFLGQNKFYFLYGDDYLKCKTWEEAFELIDYISFDIKYIEFIDVLKSQLKSMSDTSVFSPNVIRNIHQIDNNLFLFVTSRGLISAKMKEANIVSSNAGNDNLKFLYDDNTIKIESLNQLINCEIFDILGKSYGTIPFNSNVIDISYINTGMYFIKIHDNYNNIKFFRFNKFK